VVSNHRDQARDGRVSWARLAPSLLLIAAGIAAVNHSEIEALGIHEATDFSRYAWGALLAVGAVACWTWYPLRNADWLRAACARTWATAQGVATLPLAGLAFATYWIWNGLGGQDFAMPFGPQPALFLGLMFAIGLLASWLGTLCWNEASQRLPTTLAGQLIVFETLAALAYAFMLRGRAPAGLALIGITLLIAGVAWALRARPSAATAGAGAP
jgi:drug/metabolite transporter (DMT)-like permease